jgi:hypothetical protein
MIGGVSVIPLVACAICANPKRRIILPKKNEVFNNLTNGNYYKTIA